MLEIAQLAPVSGAEAGLPFRWGRDDVSLLVALRCDDPADDEIVLFADLLEALGANGIGEGLALMDDQRGAGAA